MKLNSTRIFQLDISRLQDITRIFQDAILKVVSKLVGATFLL